MSEAARYLRKTWYVAAWANEVRAGAMLSRRFLDEPVVLFRDEAGRPRALADRCAHRFVPETATSTHYFFGSGLPRAMGARTLWEMKPAILPGDEPALTARRVLEELIRAEQAVG